MNRWYRFFACCLCLLVWSLPVRANAKAKTYVYAASSLTGVITELGKQYNAKTGNPMVPVFGASSTIARQIKNGAPAHIFISANTLWMDQLESDGFLVPSSRQEIAGNRLVLAAPAAGPSNLPGLNLAPLLTHLQNGRFAIADPKHVPAGIYAKQALRALGLWKGLHQHLAIASNARLALAFIERGDAPLGIVYASDLVGRSRIQSVALIPENSHAPILYTAALIRGKSTPAAIAFLQTLQSDKARAILKRYGFKPLMPKP